MSLINKLLQDLEHRQAASGFEESLSTGVRSVVNVPRRGAWVGPGMLLLAVAAAAGLWWFTSARPAPPGTKAVAAIQARAASVPAKAAAPQAPVQVMTPPARAQAIAAVATAPALATPAPSQAVATPAPTPALTVPTRQAAAVPAPSQAAAAPAPVQIAAAPVQRVAAVGPKPPETVVQAPVSRTSESPAPKLPVAVAEAQAAPDKLALAKPAPIASAKAMAVPDQRSISPAAIAAPGPAQGQVKAVALESSVLKKPLTPSGPTTADPVDKPAGRIALAAPAQSQKTVSPQQLSDNLYKQAVLLTQQGHGKDAREVLFKSLEAAPRNAAARQMLVGLLVEGNSLPEAAALLREGVKISPEQSRLWMSLARLQMEYGDAAGATATLEQGLPSAAADAPYHAFYAALLQRAGRHEDAVKHYLVALRSDPSMPNWLVGIGISMQALGRDGDAAEAFQRAKDGGHLPAAFIAFVDQRLAQLKR